MGRGVWGDGSDGSDGSEGSEGSAGGFLYDYDYRLHYDYDYRLHRLHYDYVYRLYVGGLGARGLAPCPPSSDPPTTTRGGVRLRVLLLLEWGMECWMVRLRQVLLLLLLLLLLYKFSKVSGLAHSLYTVRHDSRECF